MKPLFIPLKSEYFDAFRDGAKVTEYRQFGPRWNESTCPIGRRVVLSRGYGKRDRLTGTVQGFCRLSAGSLGQPIRDSILSLYGSLDIEIAAIRIRLDAGAP